MHESEVEISPIKTTVEFLRCTRCNQPLATQLVKQLLGQRGGVTLREMLGQDPLCPSCKRVKLATKMETIAPTNGAAASVS